MASGKVRVEERAGKQHAVEVKVLPQVRTGDGAEQLAKSLQEQLDYDQLTNCMRCGFCLPACPTFRETGLEPESPRGRIALMKAVADGLMTPDAAFETQLNHCLGCRACEPACPADVKYGQLLEQARDAVQQHAAMQGKVSLRERAVRKLVFEGLLPHRKRLKRTGRLLGFYQRSGLQRTVRASGLMKLFPQQLREMEQIMPEATARGVVEQLGEFVPAAGAGKPVARVALFRGCLMDVLFAGTNVNSAKLLAAAGFEVVIPPNQGCCGALHAHSGELAAARELARANLRVFRQLEVDYIVSNAGGCGALLLEYEHLLQDDHEWHAAAQWFSERVIDISKLLHERGRVLRFNYGVNGPDNDSMEASQALETSQALQASEASKASPVTITYQDSCHQRNVMRSGAAPRALLRQVEGVHYVELKEADRCCGSAGTYNLVQPEMANQLLETKMKHVADTTARYVLTSNPGCLLQMKLGTRRHETGHHTEAMHVVDFLYAHVLGVQGTEQA